MARDRTRAGCPSAGRRRRSEKPQPPPAPSESSPKPSAFSIGVGDERVRRPSAPSRRSVTKSPPGPKRTRAADDDSMKGMGDSACPVVDRECRPIRIPSVVVESGRITSESGARRGDASRVNKRCRVPPVVPGACRSATGWADISPGVDRRVGHSEAKIETRYRSVYDSQSSTDLQAVWLDFANNFPFIDRTTGGFAG